MLTIEKLNDINILIVIFGYTDNLIILNHISNILAIEKFPILIIWENFVIEQYICEKIKKISLEIIVPNNIKTANIGVTGIKKILARHILNISGDKNCKFFTEKIEAIKYLTI